MRNLIVAAALTAAVGGVLPAQRLGPPVERPRLREVVDTNDALAYYNAGLAHFERDPESAAAAFYWAARLNPGWGDPLYARRAALLMSDQRLLAKVFEGSERTLKSDEMRRLDSLQFRALMFSPFLYRRLDRMMLKSYIRTSAIEESRRTGNGEPLSGDLDYAIEGYLRRMGSETRAWLAYSDGEFKIALTEYEAALSSSRDKAAIRLDRARIYQMQGNVSLAVSEVKLALEEMRKKDQKDLVIFYNSKALAEYSIGVLLEGSGDNPGAREAFGQALQEDLAYYPAHMRLGLLAIGSRDTTTAMSELALAAQLAADEPQIRYLNGWVLGVAHHLPEAVEELRKAIQLEPYYALPYLRLGQIYEQLGKGPEAVTSYQGFLDRAGMKDGQREYATGRLTEVKEILAATQKP